MMGSYADDDGEEFDNNGGGGGPKIIREGGEGGGFHDFNKKQAEGVLYKLNPMSDDVEAQMTDYVHGGAMDKDLRFAREVFGLTNTSGRKGIHNVLGVALGRGAHSRYHKEEKNGIAAAGHGSANIYKKFERQRIR